MITLKTLPQATAQEVFDQVKAHLLQQNEQSIDEFLGCMYRYKNLKCAAGSLISDEEYDSNLENQSWQFLYSLGKVPKEHNMLIAGLQIIHDEYPPDEWEEELKEIAEINNFIWK